MSKQLRLLLSVPGGAIYEKTPRNDTGVVWLRLEHKKLAEPLNIAWSSTMQAFYFRPGEQTFNDTLGKYRHRAYMAIKAEYPPEGYLYADKAVRDMLGGTPRNDRRSR